MIKRSGFFKFINRFCIIPLKIQIVLFSYNLEKLLLANYWAKSQKSKNFCKKLSILKWLALVANY